MDIGMQPAKIRDARSGPHAAEKTITLDQERTPTGPRRSNGRCDPGRSAAEDRDFIFAVDRNLACWFVDGFGGQN
jgi:hypothetical protein